MRRGARSSTRAVCVLACLLAGCNAGVVGNGHCGSSSDAGTCGNDGGLTMECTPGTCPAGYWCAGGLCGHIGGRLFCTAGDRFGNEDGCGESAACLEGIDVEGTVQSELTCYEMGPCPPEGCPIGSGGATCNVEGDSVLYPSKDAICLLGMCRDASECPSGWHCVPDRFAHFRFCSSGTPGARCAAPTDCASGACDGTQGTCQ